MKKSLLLSGILGAAVFFASCDSDSNRTPSGDIGPVGASSFVGTSVSFNPTILFLPGGLIEWVNEEVGTQFPEAPASDPLNGRFSYDPVSDFESGILTIDLDGENPIVVDIGEFVTVNGLVTEFVINFDGQNFRAEVTGDLVAADDSDDGDDENDGGGDDFAFQENGNLAAGTMFSRRFLASNPEGDVSDSPLLEYSNGQTVDFRIADDGSLVFDGVDGPLTLGFRAATDDGIINYQAESNGGAVSATLATGPSDAGSDFTILWNGPVDVFNPGVPAIDNKVFANQ